MCAHCICLSAVSVLHKANLEVDAALIMLTLHGHGLCGSCNCKHLLTEAPLPPPPPSLLPPPPLSLLLPLLLFPQGAPKYLTAVLPSGPGGQPQYVSLPADPRVVSGQCSYAVLQQGDGTSQIVMVENTSIGNSSCAMYEHETPYIDGAKISSSCMRCYDC